MAECVVFLVKAGSRVNLHSKRATLLHSRAGSPSAPKQVNIEKDQPSVAAALSPPRPDRGTTVRGISNVGVR